MAKKKTSARRSRPDYDDTDDMRFYSPPTISKTMFEFAFTAGDVILNRMVLYDTRLNLLARMLYCALLDLTGSRTNVEAPIEPEVLCAVLSCDTSALGDALGQLVKYRLVQQTNIREVKLYPLEDVYSPEDAEWFGEPRTKSDWIKRAERGAKSSA